MTAPALAAPAALSPDELHAALDKLVEEKTATLEKRIAKLEGRGGVVRIGIADLKKRYGIKASSTVYRMLERGDLPEPEYLNGNNIQLWRIDVLEKWDTEQATKTHVKKPRGIAARKARSGKGAGSCSRA